MRTLAAQIERDLAQIRRSLRRPLESEIAAAEVTAPQQAAMHVIVASPGVTLKNLSRELSLAHSTVSGIVDRLEKRGMIERQPDQADRRISRIHPTAEVMHFVRRQIPALSRGPLHTALAKASVAEAAEIAVALRRLRELLEQA